MQCGTQQQQCLRKSDLTVGWGGEESLVVLDHCDLAQARRIAETWREESCLRVRAAVDARAGPRL